MKNFYWGIRPYNFGDILTANILDYYGIRYNHTDDYNKANYFATGSIIRLARNSVILGSGIIRKNENLSSDNEYRFVRGKLTRDRVIECGGSCPDIYGDPALLLPRFIPPVEKKYKIGFVPHYSHRTNEIRRIVKDRGWHFIDLVNKNPVIPANEISSCEKILSTSLHGIIAAHAYNIPASHVSIRGTRKLHGDGSKFLDYYSSIDLEHNIYSIDGPVFETGSLPDLDVIENIFKSIT